MVSVEGHQCSAPRPHGRSAFGCREMARPDLCSSHAVTKLSQYVARRLDAQVDDFEGDSSHLSIDEMWQTELPSHEFLFVPLCAERKDWLALVWSIADLESDLPREKRFSLAREILHTPLELLMAASELASRHSTIFDFTHDLAEQSSLVRLMIAALSSGMPSLDRVRVKKAGGLRVEHVADEVMWTTAYFNRAKHALSALQAESGMLLTLLRQILFDHPEMQQHAAALENLTVRLIATFLRGSSNASAERVTGSTDRRGVDFLWAADSSRHVDQEVEEADDEEEDSVDELAEELMQHGEAPLRGTTAAASTTRSRQLQGQWLDQMRDHADSLRLFCASTRNRYFPTTEPPFALTSDGVPALWFSGDDDLDTVIDGAIRVVAYAEQCEDENVADVPSPFETIEFANLESPPSKMDLARLSASLAVGLTPYTWLCMYCIHAYEGRLGTCHLTGLPLDKVSTTRVAHRVHGLDFSSGFSSAWPTDVAEYHDCACNVMTESWAANLQRGGRYGVDILVNWWRMLPWLRAYLARELPKAAATAADTVLEDMVANPLKITAHLSCDTSTLVNKVNGSQQAVLFKRLFDLPVPDDELIRKAKARNALTMVGDESFAPRRATKRPANERTREWLANPGGHAPAAMRRRNE